VPDANGTKKLALESDVEFMALISGANFCSVCHGSNIETIRLSGLELLGNTPEASQFYISRLLRGLILPT